MGTYRTLGHDGLPCPFCGSAITDGIQFKYGWCECDDVRIGDAISWFYDLRSCYGRPEHVYCERCGGGISRESWLELRV